MKLLMNMDLYKAIVLLSVLAIPAGAWWCMNLDESIQQCRKALQEAQRPTGQLEQIGSLQHKVEVVVQNKLDSSGATNQPGTYFETQIMAAGLQQLKVDDFSPQGPSEERSKVGKQDVRDFVMDINWRRKDPVTLKFIYALLFNCESGAKAGGRRDGLQSIWKLREIEFVNALADKERWLSSALTPREEMPDEWIIKKLKFARREPAKDGRSGA